MVDVPTMLARKLGYLPVVHCVRNATGNTFQRPRWNVSPVALRTQWTTGKYPSLRASIVGTLTLQQAIEDANARAADYKMRVDVGEARIKTLEAANFKLKRECELDKLGECIAKFCIFRMQKLRGGEPSKFKMHRASNADFIGPSLAAMNDQRKARAHPAYNYPRLRATIDAITLSEFPDFPETKACCHEALEAFEREATNDQKHPWNSDE
ncbi:hypothetical protein SPRG_11906 [Saprolegnia parasitica CBS 223.65]|uniref:Uncharacterized protein n=1 Tax=Saprolegnia parasitica (strain CBS 223.65) TaxID=695850 RepID=A0A067BX04_SAPPC|nr:hypothetical protein SPRG_11906 [Saprolegnia parasitica CBS 223.65]KDO23059.1 hypothetical protein SPRG_11906 [Saprolegnia parasitica CBS 223.65]|eukprot:XP_012206176.1 hypothetical protein SPRG_11906 [Saprolegnia parasitica CBS 223.65]